MAYTNNYRSNNNGYNRSNNYSRFKGNGANRNKKRSGCSARTGWVSKRTGERVDDLLLYGWNYSRSRGKISFVAVPRKEKETTNANYEHWVVSVSFPTGKKTFTGFYNVNRRILVIPDLQMVANPNAANGGYFGRFYKTK